MAAAATEVEAELCVAVYVASEVLGPVWIANACVGQISNVL